MRKTLAIALLPLYLAACGGGGGSDDGAAGGNGGQQENATILVNGQVVDGPIAGAQVCLYSDGTQLRDTNGNAVCSDRTDANGYYSLKIPTNIAVGFLTLVASKDGHIKLASVLGTFSQVMAAAGNSGTVTPASLPGSRVTHFTTANLALADTNDDGTVSMREFDDYISDFTQVRNVAAVIKAAIDFGQEGSLIGGEINDTLALAMSAADGKTMGASGKTLNQWIADSANASVLAAIDQEVLTDMSGKFSNYQLSTVVTSHNIPPTVRVDNGSNGPADIYCDIYTGNDTVPVQIAFDASRGIVVVKHDEGQMVGSYNPQTGAVAMTDNEPQSVALVSSGITYYSEGYFKLNGTFNASTGNITGTYSEMSATTWSLDSTRRECTAGGTFTATKR